MGACSPSLSLIRLRRGGLEWPWVSGPLPMGTEMCVCVCVVCVVCVSVSRVADCSSLVMHGKFPLCWEI